MSISELGSLGELISSIVVLITLIYLAVQVRSTKKIAMGYAYQNRVAFRIDAHRQGIDPHIAELVTIVGDIANHPEEGIKNFR